MRIFSNLLALLIAVTLVSAYPAPSDPYGDSVWKSGQQVTIKWADSGSPPAKSMSGICVQLMTGPDLQQIPLTTLANKLPTSATSLPITVPDIKQFGYPPGKIYFLMFSDSATPSSGLSWTTRFTILDDSNTTPVSYTPGTPWTISKGGSPATSAVASNTTVPTATDTATTDDASSSAASSSTGASSSSFSSVVVVTSYVTGTDSSDDTSKTGTGYNTPVVTSNPDSNSSPTSSGSTRVCVWNGSILTIIAWVAFAYAI
ncbi:15542_t:CDS:2 [Acaulospora morrowiae]|uniref:15542_t:CDS:1 n=1 Tax=Acaulospora morrowiae TaxID=94023 RepID=A0A9N9AVX7_9GLOM|nr:15542_t:CDS:2 [Acaulospora morrowiae]